MTEHSFVFFSRDAEQAARLAAALEPMGNCYLEQPDPELLSSPLDANLPDVVLFDFVPDARWPDKLTTATDFASGMLARWPELACVAIGSASDPSSALAVLRAGVREFVDQGNRQELLQAAQRVLQAKQQRRDNALPRDQSGGVLIKGVRPGMGATTLAVHLASLLHERFREGSVGPGRRGKTAGKPVDADAREELARRVLVMDFGLPLADGLMYMNATGAFDAVEALQNISRLDPTMLLSTVATDADKLGVLPLSVARTEIDGLNLPDVGALCTRLQATYGAVVADIGGWQDDRFFTALSGHFRQRWLVVDQSVGALVSLADCMDKLKAEGHSLAGLGLVVNRYDERCGLTARQISERFGLRLLGALPERSLALRSSANTGQLLHHVSRRDPYVKGVQKLLAGLGSALPSGSEDDAENLWRRFGRRLTFNFD